MNHWIEQPKIRFRNYIRSMVGKDSVHLRDDDIDFCIKCVKQWMKRARVEDEDYLKSGVIQFCKTLSLGYQATIQSDEKLNREWKAAKASVHNWKRLIKALGEIL